MSRRHAGYAATAIQTPRTTRLPRCAGRYNPGVHRIPRRPSDTSREAEDVHVALLRQAPVSRRLHLAWSLSATVIGAARRTLARADPGAEATERDLRFVELHYGPTLATALRADLARRRAADDAMGT